jgi:hypothetical protein
MLPDHIQIVGDIPRIPHLNNSVIVSVLGQWCVVVNCVFLLAQGPVGIVSQSGICSSATVRKSRHSVFPPQEYERLKNH